MKDDKPLEILPWGRTLEQQEALERKKRQGKQGVGGCLLYAVAFALVAVYCAGWMQGRHYKPVVNESALVSNHRTTEGNQNALQ